MEGILNDESIVGQFTEDSFIEYMRSEIVPMMKMLSEQNIGLLKSYQTYGRMVTEKQSLEDFIHKAGNPIIDRFKDYLVSLAYREPYWEDHPKTDDGKMYVCDIPDAPNCITEAYERKGMLFSFAQGGYDVEELFLTCDKKKVKIANFFTTDKLNKCFAELGIIELWESNSFYVSALGYKFEVRFKESHHNLAHFHLSNADESASLTIPDADIREGKLKNERKAVSWSLQHMDRIVELWNKHHPEKPVRKY